MTTRELALLELEFLEKMQWRIVPRPEVLRDYYRSLVERGDGYIMAREVKEDDLARIQSNQSAESEKGKEPEVIVKKNDVME